MTRPPSPDGKIDQRYEVDRTVLFGEKNLSLILYNTLAEDQEFVVAARSLPPMAYFRHRQTGLASRYASMNFCTLAAALTLDFECDGDGWLLQWLRNHRGCRPEEPYNKKEKAQPHRNILVVTHKFPQPVILSPSLTHLKPTLSAS